MGDPSTTALLQNDCGQKPSVPVTFSVQVSSDNDSYIVSRLYSSLEL